MNKFGRFLKVFGGVLLIAALALSLYNFVDAGRAGADADEIRRSISTQVKTTQKLNEPDGSDGVRTLGADSPTVSVDSAAYLGMLEIPDLGLNLPVSADWSYDQLRLTPCRYSGSPHDGNLVICAHNYSTHFGGLSELSAGAQAFFADFDGRRYGYTLSEQEIIQPDESARMTDSGYPLTLFSCNWNGSARVTLRFNEIAQ